MLRRFVTASAAFKATLRELEPTSFGPLADVVTADTGMRALVDEGLLAKKNQMVSTGSDDDDRDFLAMLLPGDLVLVNLGGVCPESAMPAASEPGSKRFGEEEHALARKRRRLGSKGKCRATEAADLADATDSADLALKMNVSTECASTTSTRYPHAAVLPA